MLRDVYLYGDAGRTFGRRFRLDVATPHEAVRAVCTLRPGLRERLRVGEWRVIVGRPHLANAVDALGMQLGSQPLHIVPATRARGSDIGKIIGGVALIGVGILTGGAAFGMVGLLGVSMIFGGVAGMLTEKPKQQPQQATDIARPEDRPSFLFNGVINNTVQAGPVPLVFGRHLTGSTVIGASINTEDTA